MGTVIVGILGIIGTLCGVVIGQYMARSWQREQWALETRLDEYREVLTILAETYAYYLGHHTHLAPQSPKVQKKLGDLNSRSLQVIRTRILTAVEMKKHNIMDRWADALEAYDENLDEPPFTQEFGKICNVITKLAVEASEKRDGLDTMFDVIAKNMKDNGGF